MTSIYSEIPLNKFMQPCSSSLVFILDKVICYKIICDNKVICDKVICDKAICDAKLDYKLAITVSNSTDTYRFCFKPNPEYTGDPIICDVRACRVYIENNGITGNCNNGITEITGNCNFTAIVLENFNIDFPMRLQYKDEHGNILAEAMTSDFKSKVVQPTDNQISDTPVTCCHQCWTYSIINCCTTGEYCFAEQDRIERDYQFWACGFLLCFICCCIVPSIQENHY